MEISFSPWKSAATVWKMVTLVPVAMFYLGKKLKDHDAKSTVVLLDYIDQSYHATQLFLIS